MRKPWKFSLFSVMCRLCKYSPLYSVYFNSWDFQLCLKFLMSNNFGAIVFNGMYIYVYWSYQMSLLPKTGGYVVVYKPHVYLLLLNNIVTSPVYTFYFKHSE